MSRLTDNKHIKFRAWDNSRNDFIFFTMDDLLFGIGEHTDRYQRNLAVERCTDIKDKNGNEIYEGDILNAPLYGDKIAKFGMGLQTVSFSNGRFSLDDINDCYGGCPIIHMRYPMLSEIVSNIHRKNIGQTP